MAELVLIFVPLITLVIGFFFGWYLSDTESEEAYRAGWESAYHRGANQHESYKEWRKRKS